MLLTLGGEALVRGAVTLARAAGLSPAIIGLTVVALGTSLPELVVSVVAALRGQGDVTVGNVLGSNIVNLTAILGTTAIVSAIPVHRTAVRLEWPAMLAATVALLAVLGDGVVSRAEGALLVVALAAFVTFIVREAGRVVPPAADAAAPPGFASRAAPAVAGDELTFAAPADGARRGWRTGAALALGAALLAAGGHALVTGATTLAELAGLSERVIGLTVVALGTSAPELAASLVAARRGRTELAVTNVLGSNTINALGVLGGAAVVHPLQVGSTFAQTDGWWMLGTALLILPVLWSGERIGRWEGAALVGLYVTYVIVLLS